MTNVIVLKFYIGTFSDAEFIKKIFCAFLVKDFYIAKKQIKGIEQFFLGMKHHVCFDVSLNQIYFGYESHCIFLHKQANNLIIHSDSLHFSFGRKFATDLRFPCKFLYEDFCHAFSRSQPLFQLLEFSIKK